MCSFHRSKSASLASIAGNIYQVLCVESQHRYNDFTIKGICRPTVGNVSADS